jgi:caa(3)-type oxidase subunit IV
MAEEHAHPNYTAIWLWLMGLLIVSVLVSYLPISTVLAVSIIFVLSAVKALLVALNFMHLRFEQLLIHALATVPIAIFLILWLVLYPDVGLY